MIKHFASTLGIIIVLIALPCPAASASSSYQFKMPALIADLDYGDSLTLSGANTIATRRGEKYDESKDPALRRGTENWEQSQGNFLTIPLIVVAVIATLLFFSREK